MTLFERVKELCQKRGITLQSLAENTKMSINTLYKWKSHTPNVDALQRVADYFGVSTDYLLGRTDNPNSPTDSIGDEDLITFFRLNTQDLSDEDKDKLKEELKDYLEFMKKKLEK